jgi:cytochrome P450
MLMAVPHREASASHTPERNVPYIDGSHPLAGHLTEFRRDRLGLLARMARAGDVAALRLGPFPVLLFNRPEHIQRILVERAYDFDKGVAVHRVFRSVIGDGIFSSEGELHRRQRKLMAPSFQPRHIAAYAEIMGHYGEHIQQTWPDGDVVDINHEMTRLTMSIIGKALFDADVFTEADELGAAMNLTLSYVSRTMARLFPPPYGWPLPGNRRTQRAVEVLRTHIRGFIAERRAACATRSDFLSLLLQARDEEGRPMSDEQLLAECLTLFGAGHETTAAALTWCWYLLCRHPASYQQVLQEVDRVLGGRTPTVADLAQLPCCLQVLKEALRLYPPAYATSRRALSDIEIDGYLVRRYQVVLLSPYTLHRREEYYPQPEHFDPQRFTPERERLLPRHAYLPFGAGPRICIGNHFSVLEGHLLLATLAQRVGFTLISGQEEPAVDPFHHLTLRPAGALYVRVHRR